MKRTVKMDYINDIFKDLIRDCRASTTSTYIPCTHKHGWYGIVKFWLFKKKMFFCTDCNRFIDVKKGV